MLAGRRAFDGDDVSDVLASVLKTDPDWTLLPSDLPPPVRRLLRRCLEKDPKKRLRDIGEGMLQLDEGLASGATASGVMPAPGSTATEGRASTAWWRRAAPIALTAVATAAAAGAVGMVRSAPPAPPTPTFRALHVPNADAPIAVTLAQPDVALSGDGEMLAYAAGAGSPNLGIYVRRLDQLEAAPVRGTQPAIGPFFSPDGQWIGFVDQTAQDQIRKVPVLGGTPSVVVRAGGSIMGTCWTGDEILFGVRGSTLFSVNESGGEPVPLTSLDSGGRESGHGWPTAVPGTPIVLFSILSEGGTRGVDMKLAAVDRSTGAVTRFGLEGSRPRYLATGRIIYATRDGVLHSVPFDAERMAIAGAPVPVLEGVGTKSNGAASFDLSANGHLVYTNAGTTRARRTITWVDRSGRETPVPVPTRNYFYARVSPDGSRLSLDLRDEEEDVWIWDLKREVLSRLTDDPGTDQYGLWTPDHHIITASTANGRLELFRRRPDGIGQAQQLTDTSAERLVPFPNAVTPDGKTVIFRAVVPEGRNDLFVAEIGGDKTVRKLIASQHDETNAALSHDGAYVAFESDMTGNRREVFIRPFPDVEAYQVPVSTDGGSEPLWSPDGREIFYLGNDRLMAVRVTRASGRIELEKPVALFETGSYYFGGQGRNYDVDPSGQRFVMVKNVSDGPAQPRPITIVLNWGEELRARSKYAGR
jgi:serine/threonine-protein kinase